ncbi:MAG: hypothetical protein ABW168_02835 [Sedimenticola sp.]
MSKNIIIICLALLLIGSNVWQFYLRVDQRVSMGYMSGELHSYQNTHLKMERMLTYHIKDVSTEDMLKQLNTLFPEDEPFVKEGYIHSGFTSFKLDATGKYIESVGYK